MTDRKIPEKNKYYSAGAVVKEGFLGDWVKSRKGFIDILNSERGQEVFKPIIRQSTKYTYYKIKGQTLIDVLELIDKGELRL